MRFAEFIMGLVAIVLVVACFVAVFALLGHHNTSEWNQATDRINTACGPHSRQIKWFKIERDPTAHDLDKESTRLAGECFSH